MKISTKISIFLTLFYLVGCVSAKTDKSINQTGSVEEFKTFSSLLNCEKTKATDVRPGFPKDYCQILEANLKMALQRENLNLKYAAENPDFVVQATVEEISGGTKIDLFWFGFGVDRSVTKVFVEVIKNDNVVAKRSITETTIMPILTTNKFVNEDAILQDVPLIARKIAEFVKNPSDSETTKTESLEPIN